MKNRIIVGIIIFLIGFPSVFANINLRVSPIIYTVSGNPGDTITKSISVTNVDTRTYDISTAKSDFYAQGGGQGRPVFVRKSELVHPDQELSEWITLGSDHFSLAPGSTQETDFTIHIPANASPGGHYGAVFFQDHGGTTGNGQISIHADYGVLVLLTVNGDIVSSGSVNTEGVKIIGPGSNYVGQDNCPLGDYSPSLRDGECFLPIFSSASSTPPSSKELFGSGNFQVDFTVPFTNGGNVHLAPSGKIILKDSNGNILKNIGEETITNDEGAVTGEEIVDYLPINDVGGFTLPYTVRDYSSEWRGFPYKTVDANGKPMIAYLSPSEYYSEKNARSGGFLYPWERLTEKIQTEKLTADFEVEYKEGDNQIKTTNFSREFEVSYPVITKGIQPIAAIILIVGILGGVMYYGIFRRKDRYFRGFLSRYLSGEWGNIYPDSFGALSAYKNQEKSSSLRGLKKDISSLLKRYKTEDSLEKYINSLSHNISAETLGSSYHAWLTKMEKEIGKKKK